MTHIFSQRRALLFKKKDLQSANIAICRGNLAIFLSSGKFGTLPFFNLRWEFVKDDSKGNSALFLFPNSAPFASSIKFSTLSYESSTLPFEFSTRPFNLSALPFVRRLSANNQTISTISQQTNNPISQKRPSIRSAPHSNDGKTRPHRTIVWL